jgi:hypothetical protein
MKLRLLLACAVVVVSTLGAAREAGAVEYQHHVGLGPELGILKVDDKSTLSIGGGLALHYAYGLTDQLNLVVEAGGSIVAANQEQDAPETPRTRPAEIDHAGVGVGYVIDVIRWVPYVGALATGYRLSGGTLENALVIPGVQLAAGLDYQLTRSWAVGVALRQHMLLTKLSTYPTYTTGVLRLEYMWGF